MFHKSVLSASLLIGVLAMEGLAGTDYSSTEVASGGPQLFSLENAKVRLSSQLVKIHMNLEDYSVEANYTLENLSAKDARFIIGFPKTSRRWGTLSEPGPFRHFEAWADKSKIDLTESSDFSGPEYESGESAYINSHSLRGTVGIGGGQPLEIRTKYQAPYTESGDGPGGSWVRFLLHAEQSFSGVPETSRFQIQWATGVCVTTAFSKNEFLNNYRSMESGGVEYLLSNAEIQSVEEISFPADRTEMEKELGVYCFRTAVCAGQGLRLRTHPDSQSPILAKILRGESVLVVGRKENNVTFDGKTDRWYEVRTSSGLHGWVFGGYLQISN